MKMQCKGMATGLILTGLISCETYSLRQLFFDGKADLVSICKTFRDLGIPGISLNSMFLKSWEKAYLDTLKQAVADNGLVITAVIQEGDLATLDAAAQERQIKEDDERIRAAAYLGAPVIRLNLGGTGDPAKEDTVGVDRVIAAFNRLLPTARECHVKLAIENHGGVSGKADNILRIIKGTDPAWVGSCLDFGNWPADARYAECQKLAPHVFHVHAKAGGFEANGEASGMDWGRIIKMLRDAGYKGALSIEYEGGGDPVQGVQKSRDLLLRCWPAP